MDALESDLGRLVPLAQHPHPRQALIRMHSFTIQHRTDENP